MSLPKPFMYHPELYPELAKNNIKARPLVINQDINQNLKREEAQRRNSIKNSKKEITIVSSDLESSRTANNLRNSILQSAKLSGRVDPEHFTSRFDIDPILEEIAEIGVKYFIPDAKAENEKFLERARFEYGAELNGQNPQPLSLYTHERRFSLKESEHIENLGTSSHSKLNEIYAKFINQEQSKQPLPLRDLMAQMKKQNLLNPSLDLRTVPYEGGLKEGQKIFKDPLLQEKEYLENIINNFDSCSEESLNDLYQDYNVYSKDKLEARLRKDLEYVNEKIATKYLRILEKDQKRAEIRKKELPGIFKKKSIKQKI